MWRLPSWRKDEERSSIHRSWICFRRHIRALRRVWTNRGPQSLCRAQVGERRSHWVRHATGRSNYLKVDGHFHGLSEPWLYRCGDPLDDTRAVVPSSGGVPDSGAGDVVMAPWNNVGAFERAISTWENDLFLFTLSGTPRLRKPHRFSSSRPTRFRDHPDS
jgi:hypothetical protein